jgi:DNA invertase Pin-like site-specific DNA recombinase
MENQEIYNTLKRIEEKIDSVITPKEKEWYTVKETETILGISRSTFDRYKNNGQIKTTYIGRQIRIHFSVIKNILQNGFQG